MKALICLTLAVSALATPALGFAQSTDAPITRAQVRAELARLEQAGYNASSSNDANYPADVQAAEAKVAAQDSERVANNAADNMTGNATEATSMGAVSAGSSESGARAPVRGTALGATCTGPVSFCSVYFGS